MKYRSSEFNRVCCIFFLLLVGQIYCVHKLAKTSPELLVPGGIPQLSFCKVLVFQFRLLKMGILASLHLVTHKSVQFYCYAIFKKISRKLILFEKNLRGSKYIFCCNIYSARYLTAYAEFLSQISHRHFLYIGANHNKSIKIDN